MPNAIKEKSVVDLTEDMKSSAYVLVADYQGMSAEQFDGLRAALRTHGTKFKVVKNRLAKITLDKIGCKDLNAHLKGPSALAYAGTDAAAILKTLYKFAETNTNFKVKAGKVFGTVADAKSLKIMATLPSREVLLATLLARMNGPLTTLVATLNEPVRSLHTALGAVAKKKAA